MDTNDVNFYAELGLDRAASISELEAQLKALRKKWISRQNAADTSKRQQAERMVELIRKATETLLDADKKKKYDKELDKRGGKKGSAPVPAQSSDYVPMNTGSLEGAALLDALESYYDDSKYNMAIAAANQALASGMVTVDVFRYLILSYVEKGDANNALRAISNMSSALADDPDCHLFAAKILLRVLDGHERDARAHLDILFDAGYGDHGEVAALDVEYYIDTGDTALAEEKIKAYLSNHGQATQFKADVANAYAQYAEAHYTVEVGGDWYIDSEENFKGFESYVSKAIALSPNGKLSELLKTLKKRQMVPGSWISWVSCLAYAWAGFMSGIPVFGLLSLALTVVLFYFSLVPNWMIERYQYHNHLCGLYEVVRYIGIAASFIWRVSWAIFKFIWNMIFFFL